ncbi:MAG TPA: 16S rRNA (adenine(1518)-N(6)/adenine(1519)-N(6))-dimethyltransferase RsmA [Nitrospirota bacterium]|nr:16S rRNA (adenine(1518)-N(6)/adenine(1519)-N(6))-dimethyltransferase RsmA [Nitrospirota bacterium]
MSDEYIRAKKSLGQNFLKNRFYLNKMVDAALASHEDQILEIGPGLGHLTSELAKRVKKVTAIELDERLIPFLRNKFHTYKNVEIIHADALEYSYKSLHGRWKVVASLPYYLSTPIIQKLILARNTFISITLMLQREVAERISALPGGKDYGYFSVLVQLYAAPRIAFHVPPEAFSPRPRVESAIITLAIRNSASVLLKDEAFFMLVVKTAFSQRRKTLKNALKQLDIAQEKMNMVMSETGIDLGRRAETLAIEEFGRLANYLCL